MTSRISSVAVDAVDIEAVAAAELARLEGLGARRVDVGRGADVTWTVLADPEGNEFCLLSRTVDEVLPSSAGQAVQRTRQLLGTPWGQGR